MAVRKPLVLGGDGLPQQLQSADTTSTHAKFTGTLTTVPAISLGQTQSAIVVLTPVASGDSLAANEDISWVMTAALPGGINVAQVRATATNTITIDFTSSALISLQSVSVPVRVTAHR